MSSLRYAKYTGILDKSTHKARILAIAEYDILSGIHPWLKQNKVVNSIFPRVLLYVESLVDFISCSCNSDECSTFR